MAGAQRRFAVAGLEVLVRSPNPGALDLVRSYYDRYPSAGGEPGLVVDVEVDPAFPEGRAKTPDFPGFSQRAIGPRRAHLSRYDAEGEIEIPEGSGALRARFVCSGRPHAVEAVIRVGMSVALPRLGALILHASAVESGGTALAFAGVSGAGKSTLAQMLADAVPGCRKLSDELLIAARGERGWVVHVAPFVGGAGLPHGQVHPIGGLHVLEQAADHARRGLGTSEAMRRILRHVLVYTSMPDTAGRVLDLVADLTGHVPCYELAFAKRADVAAVLGLT